MSNYEQEIFAFLTEEKNFKGLITAKNHFPVIKKQLITNIWKEVYNKLEEHYKNSKLWEVKLDDNLFNYTSKVYVYSKDIILEKNGLPPFLIGWERLSIKYPFYGFWINHESAFYDYKSIMDYLEKKKVELAEELEGRDEWWAFWEADDTLDFNDDLTLIEILPINAEQKAGSMASKIVSLQEKIEKEYQYIKENFKI